MQLLSVGRKIKILEDEIVNVCLINHFALQYAVDLHSFFADPDPAVNLSADSVADSIQL